MQVDRVRAAQSVRCYRFGNVTVETQERRLLIDGRERQLTRRAFDLLLILCRSPRRVLPRDELHAALWPGGQVVSDEALTQAVFRVRAVLGAEAERIVTLRGVGIRFDADVSSEPAADGPSAAMPALPDAPEPCPPAASDAPPRRRGRVVAAVVLVALLLALATLGTRWLARPDAMIDSGYGIAREDVHAAQADTPRLLAEAIRYDNAGDRPRGRALLEALHDSDTRTPWPSLLLGLWAVGAGDPRVAEDWLARARDRVAPLRDVYMNAMLRYSEAEQAGIPEDIIRHAGAVLDLHGDAWRMRLARAHLRNYQGLREAALAEISRINVPALGNRKLESALADRASYGDVAGARAVLQRLPRTTDAAAWDYLAGRIAWSEGNGAEARAAWLRAAAEAKKNGRSDIGTRAEGDAGVAAMLAGDAAAAVAHLEAARIGMAEAGWVKDEVDVTLVIAQLHALAGNAVAARGEFERALAACRRGGGGEMMRTHAALVGARLYPGQDTDLAPAADSAAAALLAARQARNRGDHAAARDVLRAAMQRGALERTLADEARLLAAELNLPVAPERAFDPPYAPRSGIVPRLDLTRIANATR